MAVLLSDYQILQIKTTLAKKGLSYTPLQEEILDHVCTAIELKMEEGIPFHQAQHQVFDTFGKDGIQNIQEQTIHLLNQKSRIMKRLSIALLFILMLTAGLLLANVYDPPYGLPLGKDRPITSTFGNRIHPTMKITKLHAGVDFKAPLGTDVYATGDGIIEKVNVYKGGYGMHIIIRHDEIYQSLYAQLSDISVEEGQTIKKGDVIGKVGSSGASTRPHLHYEIIKNGEKVNPQPYLKQP